ncbi:hypothetical protein SLEP1_g42945 [Rubroshorea leprosula]|uniref:Uncharacterized protein n=1 Tax=Rubroshorea leprosula TaxID=152421 RepID=A0AAV5LC43_9ROSI|nr:hypothetical protein SLEP1_g42945 [Rubroshorea leprosula]
MISFNTNSSSLIEISQLEKRLHLNQEESSMLLCRVLSWDCERDG